MGRCLGQSGCQNPAKAVATSGTLRLTRKDMLVAPAKYQTASGGGTHSFECLTDTLEAAGSTVS